VTRRLLFVGVRRTVNARGTVSWMGALRGGRPGTLQLVLGAGDVVASIQVLPPDGASYSVHPLGGGYHAITHIDPGKYPPD
jgi:hypothetical protein